MASLLKKNVASLTHSVHEIQQKAITTLTVLTANLIQGETPLDSILNFYKDPSRENVTRLLVRCKKMYEARVDVKKILHSIIQAQDMLAELAAKRNPDLEE